MATRTLADRIEALPPEKRAEVEDFVDSLAQHDRASSSPGLVERLRTRRERLLRAHRRTWRRR
jgi:hypothetical protein